MNLVDDGGVDKLESNAFLNLPTVELVSFVGVSIGLDLLVDAHEPDCFFHLGQTRPVLEIRLDSLELLLMHLLLVDPPDLF